MAGQKCPAFLLLLCLADCEIVLCHIWHERTLTMKFRPVCYVCIPLFGQICRTTFGDYPSALHLQQLTEYSFGIRCWIERA